MKRIDKRAVLATYEAVENMAEVGRIFGISRQAVWKIIRKNPVDNVN